MNLDHPNKNELRMRETLQQHEFPFDPTAWQDMQAKLSGSSAESTPLGGQGRSDDDRPPGTSFTTIILLIMTAISLVSIALWFGLSQPTETNAINNNENQFENTSIEIKEENKQENELVLNVNQELINDEKTEADSENELSAEINNSISKKIINSGFANLEKIKKEDLIKNKKVLGESTLDNNSNNNQINLTEDSDQAGNAFGEKVPEISDLVMEENSLLDISSDASFENMEIKKEVANISSLAFPLLQEVESEETGSTDSIFLPLGAAIAIDPTKLPFSDIKLGVGNGFFDPRDNSLLKIETEFSHKWNRYVTNSLSLNYGTMYRGISESLSIFHVDMNIFYSPFKNNKRHNFKIGTGVSYLYADETYFVGSRFENGVLVEEYDFSKRGMLGTPIILEHEIAVGQKHILGFKIAHYSYTRASQLTGVSIKLGIRL